MEKDVDNFVEMVDLTYKLVQKFSTKSMFERVNLVEKLQNAIMTWTHEWICYVTEL